MKRLTAAALGAALLTLPTGAHADWSFTRWGMSPEQVIKAGGSKMRAVTAGPGQRVMDRDHRAAGGPFTFDGRTYMADFYFDLDGGQGLRVVRLNLLDQGQCDALGASLEKRYGASKNQHHGEWTDPATGDNLFFSKSYKVMPGLSCYLSIARL